MKLLAILLLPLLLAAQSTVSQTGNTGNGVQFPGGGSSGGGGSSPNTKITFTNVASATMTLTGVSDKAVVSCWDTTVSPAQLFIPDKVVATDADTLTFTFVPNATGYCDGSSGSGVTGATGAAGAAGGSPGGSDTQIQYNNAGAFGGTSGLTWDGSSLSLPDGAIGAPSIKWSHTGGGALGFYKLSNTIVGFPDQVLEFVNSGDTTQKLDLSYGNWDVYETLAASFDLSFRDKATSRVYGIYSGIGTTFGPFGSTITAGNSVGFVRVGSNLGGVQNSSSQDVDLQLRMDKLLASAAPSTPASGYALSYVDSTSKVLNVKNDAGTVSTTVIADTGSSNNFLTAISAGGIVSKAQPSCSSLSNASAACSSLTSLSLVTPSLGVATATSINGLTLTTSTGTFTLTNGKTFSALKTITLDGTDSTTMTFPATSATIARTDAANTFTGTQTIGALVATTVNGNTFTTGTGVLTIAASKTLTASNTLTLAGTDSTVMTFPTTSATIARTDAAQSFTGVQTFVAPILGTPTSATLTNATGLPAAGVVGTAAILGANTFTGAQTYSVNGALSTPGLTATGTWVTGGSATTTKPYALIETTGATSTAWSTSGTGLGVNAASGFAGNLIDFQTNGTSEFKVTAAGAVTSAGAITSGSTLSVEPGSSLLWTGKSRIKSGADGNFEFYNNAANDFGLLRFGGTTSSFPALKRSTTKIQLRLADDSAAGTIEGKYNSSDGTAGATVTTCTGFKDGLCISGS